MEEADQQWHDSEEALHCCWTGCGQDYVAYHACSTATPCPKQTCHGAYRRKASTTQRTSRSLIQTLNSTLDINEKFSMVTRGKPSNIHTLHCSGAERDPSSPSGWKSKEYTKEVLGRFVPVSESVAQHYDSLITAKTLRTQVRNILFAFWIDGSSSIVFCSCALPFPLPTWNPATGYERKFGEP